MNEFKWFFRTMPHKIRNAYSLSFVLILISSLITMAIPMFYKAIIDSFQLNDPEGILKNIMYYLLINAVSTFFFWLGEYIFRSESTRSVKYYMEKTYSWGLENKSSINPEAVVDDPLAFGNFLSLIYGIIDLIRIPVPLIFIFILDKTAFFISLATIIVWILYIKYDRKYVDKNQDEIITNERENFQFIDDSIKGFEDIKITETFTYEMKKIVKKYAVWYKKVKKYIKNRNVYLLTFEIMKIATMVGFIVYAFYGLYKNKYLLGTVFALISYYDNLESPIITSFSFSQYIGYYKKIINNMRNTKDKTEVQKERVEGEIEEIELRDIEFSYGENKILDKVSIKIKRGEKVALIGKSGEGKTTLVKIITGSEIPQKGKALMNGKEIYRVENVYEKIGVLSQNSHIFNRSIKENITMGRKVKEEELERILEMSGVKSFLNNTEEGLEKNAGQNGNSLSGGQRVRIALARMMISDPEIIILDEPLEGVDKIKEEEVISNIRKYTENKTLIIISHRFSILSMATRIIGIEKGRVVLEDKKEKALKDDTILKEFFDAEKRMTENGRKNI